jgi:hypothetical protein
MGDTKLQFVRHFYIRETSPTHVQDIVIQDNKSKSSNPNI